MKKRIVSGLLSLIMLLCVFTGIVPTANAASNDYTTWKQFDSAWGNVVLWPNAQYPTMAGGGCWITSVAILLRHYKVVTDSNVDSFNPLVCARRLMECGIVNSNGDYQNLKSINNAYPGFSYVGQAVFSESKVKELYNQGYACIVHETKGHYVAVRDVSGSSITVMDPGSSYTTTLSNSDFVQYYRVDSHTHTWNNIGKCSCGASFNFDATLDYTKSGYYKVVKSDGFYIRTSGPYDAASKEPYKLTKGTTVKVLGKGYNSYGASHPWYKISYNNGASIGYAYDTWLEYSKPLESSISIDIKWPYENQTIPRQSHNLIGTVKSGTNNLKTITSYLDGSYKTTVSVNTTSFSLEKSDIDIKGMPFNTISSGRHTIKIVATDTAGGTQSFTRVFYTESSPCEAATVSTENDANGKGVIMSCPGANIKYTTSDGKSGSGSGSVRAHISYTTTFTITTSKNGRADNVISKTIYVDQVQAPQFNATPWYGGTKVAITSTPGAQIYFYYTGTMHGEYHEPFNETRNITVYAYAVKAGMRDSETTSYTIQASKPDTPAVQLWNTENKIAVGKTANFKWNADARAKEYSVSLYKDGALVNSVTQESNIYSCVLDNAGKYEVSVKALSPLGDSGESTKVAVTAMAPSTVQFVDDDGSVLAKYTVSYGEYVSRQNQPSHRGYYFSGWYPSNNYYEIPVTSDVTYKATYTPIEYDVTFYDVDGLKFGDTQKVSYQQSAVAPDYSSMVPDGYVFSGWTVIEASENDSACDYTCVDANLKLQAVVRWGNDELPVYASITSAKLEQEGSKSVYKVNVKVTNWPKSASSVYIVAALKTQDPVSGAWKTVSAERMLVNLDANYSQVLPNPIKLYYDGIAKKVEVYVLERKDDGTTGSAYSQAVSANVVFSTNYTNWSDWSTTKPENKTGRTIETKTEYRYQDKNTTTSSSSSMSGWTRYDSSWQWGSWGSWSSWSDTKQTGSDSKQVESRTEWRYYYFYCPVCGGHEPFQGTSDCHKYSLSGADYYEKWFPTSYKNSSWHTYSYTSAKYWTESLGDGQRWNFTAGNLNDTAPGTQDYGYYGQVIRTAYRYRTRSQVWTYYFYRWTDWSSWSDTAVSSSSTRNVETRTVYRYRDEVPIYDTSAGTEDTSGTPYRFTGTINSEQDLAGKVATVMVYQSKNMDPNQYQMQYVGQTTLLANNGYDISFIPIKDPTIESGNYVVALGIQGTTGLLSVDVVEAPKAEYTVRFLMDDGGVISSQTVIEGGNAEVPAIPAKAGYRFVGWSERSTGIFKNTDIIAKFEKEQYLVAFVDWVNESIGFQKYYYGDTITSPYSPSAEGRTFIGWDAILDGNSIVTDNMVVTAVYDQQTFTVRFLDAEGNEYQKQQVAYGEAALLPDPIESEDKVFLGWSTDVEWWNVTSNLDVKPILAYKETTMAPATNVDSFEIGMEVDVELTSEEGAAIFYTADGSAPTRESAVYRGPIHLTETTIISAIAVSEGKNDSEAINVFFVHDETPVEDPTAEVLPLDIKKVDAVPNLEIPLEVEIKYNPGLIGFSLVLECDRSVFFIDADDNERVAIPGEVTKYGDFTVKPFGETGWIISWLCSYPTSSDGILFTVPLKAGEEIESGNYDIKLGYVIGTIYTENREDITLNREMVHFTGSDITHEHSYSDAVTQPTCTEQGYTTHSCICGDSYIDSYVSALGHNYVDGVCSRCGANDPNYKPIEPDKPCDGGASCPGKSFTDMPKPNNWAHAGIDFCVENGLFAGTSATTFSPDGNMTRAMLVTVLYRLEGQPAVTASNPFSDVANGQWFTNAIIWAADKGVVSGVGGGKFNPNGNITREQIATIMYRYAEYKSYDVSATADLKPFPDETDVSTWAYKALAWANAEGLVSGVGANGTSYLQPLGNATRAQVAAILMRYVKNIAEAK